MTTQAKDEIDVKYVADLARIELTDEETETFQREITEIVGYVRLLQEVDVEGIEPTAHAMPVVNVLRDDVPRPSLDRDRVLANAPAIISEDSFRVPAILVGEEESA
ncbi:MAG: Asp-tRNA(Asn)/Glu-tRNA(Gln) amidotransferase subunit GatC [Lentisphaeria bacterium]|nr:Asp-tRNA(Asn)/Glu-tRNA(Gln) amidotransferase subunit GatC [Lentisphaeria bacterium]